MSFSLVSIIMPAYNGEQYIKQAIESVLAQTYNYWELVIIDDGSTDTTAQILSAYNDSRILYIFQENRGQAAALNHGLDLARGEYVTTLDVDDWFTENSLGDRVGFLDTHPYYDVVYGDGIFCDKDGNQLKLFSEMHTGEISGDVFDTLLTNSFFGTGANVMIRKSILDKYHIRYDESIVWCQDYDLYLQLAEKCQFGYIKTTTVWYRLHSSNMTTTLPSDSRRKSLVRVKQKALATPRFLQTKPAQKFEFYLQLLIYDSDDWESTLEVINHPSFLSLSNYYQARVIRLIAAKYLPIHKSPKEIRKLLKKSLSLNPFDPKTSFVLVLSFFNKSTIEYIFNSWQKIKHTSKIGRQSLMDDCTDLK